MKQSSAPLSTPNPAKGEVKQNPDGVNQRRLFLVAVLDMSWQLAIVVLVPIIAGVELDKKFGTGNTLLFVGLGLAVVLSTVVMWRTIQAANRLPVPKLTAAQKRAIKKSYEEEDKDE